MGFGGMPQDPERWQRALQGVVQWRTEVDYSNDGGANWLQVPYFFGGSVTCDTTQQYRWSTSGMRVGGVRIEKDITPFHTRFRVRHGIEYPGGDTDLLGMGVYQCLSASDSTTENGVLQISGKSFESYLIKPRGSFPKRRQLRPNSARYLVETLVKEVLPRASIAWSPDIDANQQTPLLQSEDDRWELIDGQTGDASIARALGARIYCDGDGGWRVDPPGALSDPISWTSEKGDTKLGTIGTAFGSTRSLSNDGVYNVISVKGQSTDGSTATLGPIIVADTDPYSPTYSRLTPDDGGFGLSVRYYTSSMFTSTLQMVKTGQSMLAQSLGLRQSIDFERRYDPSILPGKVGLVDTNDGLLRVICDSLTYDLGQNPSMSGTARTTSSRYSGQVSQWNDVEGSGGADDATS